MRASDNVDAYLPFYRGYRKPSCGHVPHSKMKSWNRRMGVHLTRLIMLYQCRVPDLPMVETNCEPEYNSIPQGNQTAV